MYSRHVCNKIHRDIFHSFNEKSSQMFRFCSVSLMEDVLKRKRQLWGMAQNFLDRVLSTIRILFISIKENFKESEQLLGYIADSLKLDKFQTDRQTKVNMHREYFTTINIL